ncbi:proline-rich protein 12 [Hoplias malabaricus]|uniref:proline-rich protein 12 n=1 Tax=Hoplias malabaricus TaxID=27720 RepID=UPI003461C278
MERNYPGAGFGDLGAGAGWSYERSAKASLVYGSSRSSHPESELLHRQAYATPHPLQSYATNHHPGSSGQGGAWGAAGRSLSLSGLFDAGLHHASPSGPDPSVMNLISALESRGPQPPPSASSLLSQFRTPSWQTAMHTPAPAELFISGALPGSGSFPSSSALSAYQHPASFSGRSFPGVTPSLSLQDTPTFSPTSNGLLSPHDPLLHIKTPSQSGLGFDRLLSTQGAAAAYRGSHDPSAGGGVTSAQASSAASASARHLQSHQFNLLSSQLQDQSSQLYSASVFSSTPAPPQPSSQERTVPRQDSVIKHYQRPSPAQASASTPHPLQHYLSCGVSGYQQAPHPRHAGLSCSPLGEHSPSSDHKPSPRTEQYRPIIQPSYGSSSSSSSGGPGKGSKSSSSSGYSSSGSGSSSRTPHTPPSASSASSSSSSSSSSSASAGARQSNSIPTSSSTAASSRQQPSSQSVSHPPQTHSQPPPSTSNSSQQPLPKACLSGYGSPVAPVKSSSSLTGQTPPQQQPQSFSPSQPPPSHLSQSYGGFSSPQTHDLPSARTSGVSKGYGNLGSQSFSAESVYGTDSGYGSLPPSLGGAGSPSMGYAASGHSPALLRSGASGGTAGGTSNGASTGTGGGNNVGGGGGGGGGGGSYHIPDSSPSPSGNSGIIRPGLHSPAPSRPAQSPVGTGSNKYLSSVLSPSFLPSPQGFPDTRGARSQAYHPSAPPKTKSDANILGVAESRPQQDDDDDDDFLIQHLLQAQSPTPQTSHHHAPQSHHSSQPTQQPPVLPPQDGNKGLFNEMSKSSEERYHLQSVIRTHSANSNAAVSGAASGAGLDGQLEMSLKKQHQQQQQQQQHKHQQQQQQQQQKSNRTVPESGGRGSSDQTHTHHHHDSMGSVVHYGQGDPYSQHSMPQHPSSHHQHAPHTPTHTHLHAHSHMDLQKKTQDSAEMAYMRKTPDLQQHHHQHQQAHQQQQTPHHQTHQQQHQQQQQQQRQSQSQTLMDSPTDQSHQPSHLLQSVLSHTTRSKMDPQQQQHTLMEAASGVTAAETHTQPQASQLQLQLQTQALEAASHYGRSSQHQDQNHAKSTTVSSLDMLERSLSRTSSQEGGMMDDRVGNEGSRGSSGGTTAASVERHRSQDQQRLSSHHPPQHHQSELHSYLSDPDLGLSTPTHGHHLSHHHHQPQQPPQASQLPNSHHQHAHQQHPSQQSHHHLAAQSASATAQQPEQPHRSAQLPQGQLEQQHQADHHFDTRSSAVKNNQSQNQSQQSQRFVPLTSICFPDSLLPDEDRSFFPAMEDMFCPEEYKSSCPGGSGQSQDGVAQPQTGQEGMEGMKATPEGGGDDTGASYDMLGPHGDQDYGQYCHDLSEPDNATMHLDLDSLKTHELPSTVNTEQLGLIQSQPPSLGMGNAGNVGEGSGGKLGSSGGTGSGTGGLTSPIFCSSRPKKLLKSSSFHLLKERPDPNSLPKKSYAQEYEFEDDEDKANVPADIRLNSRRLPDLIPDLVSSCRKSGGTMSPLMGDLDFGYHSLGPPPQLLPNDGPKKRGRKPTKPKREGPPRPRGRPRIRPLPEPHHSRGMLGECGGGYLAERGRTRGRGRGRGRRDETMMDMDSKEQGQLYQQHMQQQSMHHQSQQQEPIKPIKIKLPIGTMSSSDALLRTDSLSGTDPALSDGSVGSAPSLGLSPGTPGVPDLNRPQDKNKSKTQEMEEKESEKTGFVASFLDFLKSGKRSGSSSGNGDSSPGKSGGIRPISPPPPPPPAPAASSAYGDSEGDGGLSLGGCPSPCKRLDEELKRNLETLPSFSSDEEDSVGKNQDLQKSISSAISALYDTPQLSTTTMQPPSLPPPPPAPLTPTQHPPSLSPQTPTHLHTQPPSQAHTQSMEPAVLQREEQDDEAEEEKMKDVDDEEEEEEEKEALEKEPEMEMLTIPKVGDSPKEAPQTAAPSSLPPLFPSSPEPSSSPSPPPLPPLSLPSPLPQLEENPSPIQQSPPPPSSPVAPSLPVLSPPAPAPPPSASPPHSSPPPSSPPPPPPIPTPPPAPPQPAPAPSSPEETPVPQILPLHLAQKQSGAAITGETDEDESESAGEGIFRERDEFVVRIEDIRTLKMALQTGREPPPIWRVQKALLQKFAPEIKDGQRQFCATSNYLGYFGDAKKRYQRLYVKFLENVNKKDYVRVCSRKPWHRPSVTLRRQQSQSVPKIAAPPNNQPPPRATRDERAKDRENAKEKEQREAREKNNVRAKDQQEKERMAKLKEREEKKEREKKMLPPPLAPQKTEKRSAAMERAKSKEEKKAQEEKRVERKTSVKQQPVKVKAEPPPKKRRKWLKVPEVPSSSESDSSASEEEISVKAGLNTRVMKEMYRSYVEMLVSTALDPDMIQALEDTEDELYLPPMRKIDSILVEQKRKLLKRVNMSSQHQEALHAFPQIKAEPLDSGTVRLRLGGECYNRKTLNRVKKSVPKPQDFKLSTEMCRFYSLYHSLHHYKYHTFLICKKETVAVEQASEDPGQEEVVQQCMANQSWLDTLFNSFLELMTLSAKA